MKNIFKVIGLFRAEETSQLASDTWRMMWVRGGLDFVLWVSHLKGSCPMITYALPDYVLIYDNFYLIFMLWFSFKYAFLKN